MTDDNSKTVAIVAAVADDGAIGRGGELLCRLPADMRHFKTLTMGHTVVMGRRTFESLPGGPLPGRENIVVTRNSDYDPQCDGVRVAHSLDEAIAMASMPSPVMVIGGGEIYRQAVETASLMYLTRLHASFADADTHFPAIDADLWQQTSIVCNEPDDRNTVAYDFVTLERKAQPDAAPAADDLQPRRYLVLAGEASGDLHGAHLIAAMRRLQPGAEFRFFGGDMMAGAAGGPPEVHYRDMAYMGFTEVIRHLPTILGFLKRAKRLVDEWQPTAVILIDYPSFNLKVAKYAAARGITVHYFISPKVWVWKQWRVKDIRRYVSGVYCILPFEPAFYRSKGYHAAVYVGNPTVGEIAGALAEMPSRETFCSDHALDAAKPIVALVPGSRLKEIRENLPVMLAAAARHADCQPVIAAAPGVPLETYHDIMEREAMQVPLVAGETFTLVHHAAVALVTSGTATLETALLGTPQVVCYRMNGSRLAYLFLSKMLSTTWVALPNLIAGEMVIPELLLHQCTVDAIDEHLTALLPPDSPARRNQLDGYRRVAAALTTADCALTTATLICNFRRV